MKYTTLMAFKEKTGQAKWARSGATSGTLVEERHLFLDHTFKACQHAHFCFSLDKHSL